MFVFVFVFVFELRLGLISNLVCQSVSERLLHIWILTAGLKSTELWGLKRNSALRTKHRNLSLASTEVSTEVSTKLVLGYY